MPDLLRPSYLFRTPPSVRTDGIGASNLSPRSAPSNPQIRTDSSGVDDNPARSPSHWHDLHTADDCSILPHWGVTRTAMSRLACCRPSTFHPPRAPC